MEPALQRELSEYTRKMSSRPILNGFVPKIPETYVGYHEKISHPMDLTTVADKLNSGAYKTIKEWYDDVCLVFENAMSFYTPHDIYYQIAEYYIHVFEKDMKMRTITDGQEWLDMISKEMKKIEEILAENPIPQGVDPMLLSIIKNSKDKTPPNPATLSMVSDELNKLLVDNVEVRRNIYLILRTTCPGLKYEGKPTFELEDLNETAKCAICAYAETVIKKN